MSIEIHSNVKCIFTNRAAKAYAKFGRPAKVGDVGKVLDISYQKDVSIVQIQTDSGIAYSHIQNLLKT